MAQHADYEAADPEWEKIAATLPAPVGGSDDTAQAVARARQTAIEYWAPNNRATFEPRVAGAEYKVEDHVVPVQGGEIRVRVVTPASQGGTMPLLFYMHGGGFWAGDIDMKDWMLRALSNKLKVVSINVEYRTEPAPRPQDDCFAALKWAVTNSNKFAIDLKKGFVIMGSSAGGQLAALMTQLARDDPFFRDTPLTGQIVQIPIVCHPDYYPEQYKSRLLSLDSINDPRFLTKSYIKTVVGWLGGDPAATSISPLLAPSLAGLPKALVQVVGRDPLRDEGILYAELMREAGVDVKLEIYPGVPHGFEDKAPETMLGKKYMRDVEEAIKSMVQSH